MNQTPSPLVSTNRYFMRRFISVLQAQGGIALHSPKYHLLPCDLREPPSDVLPSLIGHILSPGLPTLLLFECVLVYMSSEASSALIQWFVDHFSPSSDTPSSSILGAIVYEMFGLEDAFGQVMKNNLRASSPITLHSNHRECHSYHFLRL